MPRPLSERESLEQEQAELASGIAAYRQELEHGALRRVRREYLAWQIEHAERRLADVRARLAAIRAESA